MSNIIKIDPKQFGLSETKAAEVSAMFRPMLDKMEELETEFNRVAQMAQGEITPEVTKAAKEVRLQYVSVRTGTAKIHKDLKAFYLQGGRLVDAWKNAQLAASSGIEEKLKEIEEHYERIEAARIESLQTERAAELGKYQDENIPANLGSMDQAVWDNFISGAKTNHENRIEAERKAEEERVAAEAARIAEEKRIRDENERLRKEAEEATKAARIEAAKREKEEAERKAKEEAEQKAREEEKRKIEEANRAALEAVRKEAEEKARIEREAREAAEAQVRKAEQEAARIKQEAAEAEARKVAEEKARIEAEKAKGDDAKFADLKADIITLAQSYEFQAEASKAKYEAVKKHLREAIKLL